MYGIPNIGVQRTKKNGKEKKRKTLERKAKIGSRFKECEHVRSVVHFRYILNGPLSIGNLIYLGV